MALTEYEKKILEQMEASLREEDPALGVAGFALTVAGILYALSRPGVSSSQSADESSERGAEKGSGWNSFIQDQERRWDDRRDND